MTATPVVKKSRWPQLAAGLFALGAVVGGVLLFVRSPEAVAKAPVESMMRVAGDDVTMPQGAPQLRYVVVDTAQEAPPLPLAPAPGRVAVDDLRTSALSAPLPGRVERVLVRVGDRVTKGQRLLAIRSGALADVERDVAAAQVQLEAKRRVVAHVKELVALQSATARELLEAEEALSEAELEAKAARARRSSLTMSDASATLLWLRSPRDGTVVDLSVFADLQVSPEAESPLVRIADLREVIVYASVQEPEASALVVGQEVQVAARGKTPVSGVLESIGDVVDPSKRTVELRVRVPNDDWRLRPNAFVEVAAAPPAAQARVRVPTAAVVSDGRESVVFVQNADTFSRTPVQLGRQQAGEVEILAGLEPGRVYVAGGALLLMNVVDLAR